MDLNDLWQENKRFLTGVGIGALAFVMGLLALGSSYGQDLSRARADHARLTRELGEPRYDAGQREAARAANRALEAAVAELAAGVVFQPRPEFVAAAEDGLFVNQYHRTVSRVRERLLVEAGRRNLHLDRDLGLPELSPSRADEIERYLAGLDCVERAVELALHTGVERVEDVRIRLAPTLGGDPRTGVERTRVELALEGSGAALSSFLERSQRSSLGPLVVEEAELGPARGRSDATRLVVAFAVVRLAAAADAKEGV